VSAFVVVDTHAATIGSGTFEAERDARDLWPRSRGPRTSDLPRDRYTPADAAARPGHHVDHIVPVACGGSDHPSNVQVLCEDCNLAKAAR
jgi:5-methylcytosine-specific restriction endonuclease McrA